MTDNSQPKGLAVRILGEQPTLLQEVYFWLVVLSSLLIWTLLFFASLLFAFGAPSRTTISEICHWGMLLTIWLYPFYLLPLIGLWFRLSKLLRARWLYYFFPLIPVAIFYLFVAIDSSELAARKPKGYDSSTFKRINQTYATDVNHVYFDNEVLEEADPASFRVLKGFYSADNQHVWYLFT